MHSLRTYLYMWVSGFATKAIHVTDAPSCMLHPVSLYRAVLDFWPVEFSNGRLGASD
jgi:hypothetical protein